jgi:hypothetical protein
MTDQPEALRVADELDDLALCSGPQAFWPLERVAARLLREQHAEIENLISRNQGLAMQNSLLRATVEAMKVTRGVT